MMYIDPYVAGVLSTIGVEAVLLIVIALVVGGKK